MKKYLFCFASVLALAPSAMSGPIMPSDFPHLMPSMADFFGPTMDDFLGRGKDWLEYPTLDVDGNFVFENDFAALRPDVPDARTVEAGLLVAEGERGQCRVLCFSPVFGSCSQAWHASPWETHARSLRQ